jgi:hypothetical protein
LSHVSYRIKYVLTRIMSFTNNGSKLTGKSITNSFNVVADNITVEKNELIKGNLTVLGTTNIGNVTLENGNVNNLTVNNLTVTTPIPYTSGGTGLSTIGSPNQVLTVNPTGTGLYYQGVALTNPSTITGTGFTGTPTFNFGIESSGGGNGRGFIRTSATATELVLGSTTSDVLRLSGSGGSANLTYNSSGSSGVFQVTNAGGAITFTNSNAGTISMATAGGSITLGPVSLLTPAVNINTAGGIFNLSTGAGQMDIVTALGVMNIGTGGGPLNISTGVGNLSITATTGILSLTTAAAGAVNLGASGLGLVNLYGSALTISSGAVNLLSGAWTGQTGLWNVTTLAFGLQTASCNISSLASITLQTLVGTIILNGTNTTMNGSTTITASTTPLVMNITGSAPTSVLTCFQASMADYLYIFFGKSAATNLSASIRFKNNNTTPANNYLGLGFYGNDDLMVLAATGELFLNGPKLQQSIPGSVTSVPLSILQSTLATSNYMALQFGRENAVALSGVIQYNHTASTSTNSLGFGFTGVNNLMTLSTSGTLSVSGNAYVSQNINWGTLEVNSNTALTVNSPKTILVRGGPGVTITLPNATTLTVGWNYIINNNSNNTITISDFTSTLITTVLSGQLANVYLLTNPNTAGTWDYHLAGSVNSVTATSPIVATGTVNPVISISPTDPITLGPLTLNGNFLFGNSAGSGNRGRLEFVYDGNNSLNNRIDFGFVGNFTPLISMVNNWSGSTNTRITLTGGVNCNGRLTVLTSQTTIPLSMSIVGAGSVAAMQCFQASMATTNEMDISWGRQASTNNCALLNFYYDNFGSTGNFLGLGFNSNSTLYKITAAGAHIWRNTTAETMSLDANGTLLVNGKTGISHPSYPLELNITGSGVGSNTAFSCYMPSMGTDYLPIVFGKSGASNLSASIRFRNNNASPADNYLGLGFFGNNDLYQINVGGAHYWSNSTAQSTMVLTATGQLFLNGPRLQQTIPGTGTSVPLSILQSTLATSNYMALQFGRENALALSAVIQYNHTASTSTNSIGFGFTGANNLMTLNANGTLFLYDVNTGIDKFQFGGLTSWPPSANNYGAGCKMGAFATYATNYMFMFGNSQYINFRERDTNAERGYIWWTGGSLILQSLSDYRKKSNVTPLTNSLTIINQLKPCTYLFEGTHPGTGFLAHELQEHIPEAVQGLKDEIDDEGNPKYQTIGLSALIPHLTGALKDLYSLVQTLQARITTLESQ